MWRLGPLGKNSSTTSSTPDGTSISSQPNQTMAHNDSPTLLRKPRRPPNLYCSHTNMTRLFTNEFSCDNCHRPTTSGWIWRCIQDRELMLEDEMDRGIAYEFDNLSGIFGRPPPLKGGPTARRYLTNTVDELDSLGFEYTKEQRDRIIAQRAKVLDLSGRSNPAALFSSRLDEPRVAEASQTSTATASPGEAPMSPSRKPWLPIPGGECKVKWCHQCRPSSIERSYLSIDAIVNGDIPLTATTGYGFHMLGARPVSDARIVRNLGLRPNPGEIPDETVRSPKKDKHRAQYYGTPDPVTIPQAAVPVGLGIVSNEPESSKLPRVYSQHFDRHANMDCLVASQSTGSLPELKDGTPLVETPLSPTNASFPPEVPFDPAPFTHRRHSISGHNIPTLYTIIPLPAQTQEEIDVLSYGKMLAADDGYDGYKSESEYDDLMNLQLLTPTEYESTEEEDYLEMPKKVPAALIPGQRRLGAMTGQIPYMPTQAFEDVVAPTRSFTSPTTKDRKELNHGEGSSASANEALHGSEDTAFL